MNAILKDNTRNFSALAERMSAALRGVQIARKVEPCPYYAEWLELRDRSRFPYELVEDWSLRRMRKVAQEQVESQSARHYQFSRIVTGLDAIEAQLSREGA